jgi:hypothetical protein
MHGTLNTRIASLNIALYTALFIQCSHCTVPRMSYTRGIVVEYQYQGAGIGIVLLIVKTHLYPIPNQYQNYTWTAAIRSMEKAENMYFQVHKTS